MVVKTITYSRLMNLGNFEHEKFELTIELADGETPNEAVNRARAFIKNKMIAGTVSEAQYQIALKVVSDELNHTGAQVKEAKDIITRYKVQNEALPF